MALSIETVLYTLGDVKFYRDCVIHRGVWHSIETVCYT